MVVTAFHLRIPMKHNVGDIVFSRLHEKNQKGRVVVEVKKFGDGNWCYKFEAKDTASKFVWVAGWMLYTQEEFVGEVKAGTLLAMHRATIA